MKYQAIPDTNQVNESGLRYVSKASGTPYVDTPSCGPSTRSCFFCGRHNSVKFRAMQRVLGRSEPVCLPSCSANPKSRIAPVGGNE
jgi:hypothetical protein